MATGQFGTIIKPMAHRKGAVKEFQYLQHKDRRMRFNNAQDPIYYIFDCIENRPVSKLAKEFKVSRATIYRWIDTLKDRKLLK